MAETKKSGKYAGFTAEEIDAMKNRAKELKAEAANEDAAAAQLAKIAELSDTDRATAERIQEIVFTAAPELKPKLYYGMPGYAKDGKIVCFFQPADKFKTRYSTFGFNDTAALDDGTLWPTSYALTSLDAAAEAKIAELVKKAAG